jgi:hypothetical protein
VLIDKNEEPAQTNLHMFDRLGKRKKRHNENMLTYITRIKNKTATLVTQGIANPNIIMLAILNGLDQLESYAGIVNILQNRVGSYVEPIGIEELTQSLVDEEFRHKQRREEYPKEF